MSGQVGTLAGLLDELKEAGGVNPTFEVETGEVRIVDGDGARFVVLYEERTRGAKMSRAANHVRWVTALLKRAADAPGGFRWHHLHEVQVRPPDEI